jgi:hypothetical protein
MSRRSAEEELLHIPVEVQGALYVLRRGHLPGRALAPASRDTTPFLLSRITRRLYPKPQQTMKCALNGKINFRYQLRAERVISNRHQLLVGPRHPLAASRTVTMFELANQPIWMPGLPADIEQSAYYDDLAGTFGLTIDVLGPNFGAEALLDEIAASTTRATFIGETDRYVCPASHGLRRITAVDPTPVYPLSAIWREDNPHPALGPFLGYLQEAHASQDHSGESQPRWANTTRVSADLYTGYQCDRVTERPRPAHGHGPRPLPIEQAALKYLHLVTRSLDPTGTGRTRWAQRWKPALNAFAITFGDRFPAAEAY